MGHAWGGAVRLVGFGAFGLRERPVRTGGNPATGTSIAVPASRTCPRENGFLGESNATDADQKPSAHLAPTLDDLSNPHRPSLGDRSQPGRKTLKGGTPMILMARPRPAILFVVVAVLVLSLAGVPAAAQDGSVPARPTGLSTVATHESVTLTWNSPDDDSITHYKVLRRDPEVHAAYWFVNIEDDTGTADTRYTDDTVKPEKRYFYRVKAVNARGVSTWSRHAKAITPAAPAPEPTLLTASFVDMPAEHDGGSAFRFRVAFSEPIAISFRSLREDAFAVSGGRVTRGTRVDRRKDLFEITVEPDRGGEVTISLPAGRECSVSGAICTWGPPRKPLTNTPAATVAGPAAETAVEPLTASFVDMPAEHDGGSAFRFRVAFSEPIAISFRSLREDAFAVSGGRVTGAGRVDRRKDLFRITVEPDRGGEVTISLPAGRECSVSGAICTWGPPRKPLTNTPAATVAGPAAETAVEPLTASFVDMPAEHDGGSAFRFRVAFSEPIAISFRSLREDAFAVSGGRVTGAGRVDRRKDLFRITVEPDRGGEVTISLPAGRECSVSGAICTWGPPRKPLTNRPTATVAGPEDSNENSPATGAPAIAGTARVGETLTAETASIADTDGLNNPNFTYQWVSCGGPTDVCILGATNSTYTLGADDEGKTIKVLVSFIDDAGNSESLASDTVVVPLTSAQQDENTPATGAPTIAGTAQVGDTLMAQTSGIVDADGLNSPNFAYQWVSCGGPTDVCILGATDSTYTLVADDEGKTIKVLVSFTDDAGNPESLTSDTVVVPLTSAQQDENTPATGAPTIAGTAQVGETLTAQTSGIVDADGLNSPNFAYQWVSCGGPTDVCILGATNSTYTLVADDEGKTIKVLVSFTDDAGNPESLTSDTVVVSSTPTPANENTPATGAPTIAGTAQVGETLTADVSGIADADGLSNPNFTYQWVSCGGPTDVCILGATNSTYTLVAADGGKSVKVIVSFTDDAGNPESLTSNVAAVSSTPPPTGELQPPGAPGMPNDSLTYHVEDGRNWVTFRWTRASGVVDGYEVLRGQNSRSEFEGKVVARIDDPNATSYEDHTVIESSDYFFAVRAFNSAGTSGLVTSTACRFLDSVIAEGSQGLAYPDNLTARLTENGTAIALTWTAPMRGYHGQDVSPATGYQILRWDLRRGYPNYDIHVDNTGSTATSYVDRDITPNNTFIYQVRAWNDWGLGDRSFGATVKTMDLDVVGAPRNFRVSSSSEGAALTWDAPEDVADTVVSYRIYRREHSGATVPLVLLASDHGATSYTDGTVVPGTEYHYQVRVDGDPLGSRHGIPTKLRYGRYLAPQDLSVAPVAPDADPAALSVAGARAREGRDETIDFRVSLSRAMSAAVTVDYATEDGRGMAATAGEDYTPVSGTLTFAPGETAKTVAVPILDDVIDEGEEAFALRLSNARGARIANAVDAVGIGWIVNSDPLQQMWLSRFGRTVAGHVVDAVAGRLSRPPVGSQVTLGGRSIDLSARSDGIDDSRPGLTRTLGVRRGAEDGDTWSGSGAWEASRAGSWAGPETDGATSRTLTGRELLLGSSFHLAAGGSGAEGPGFAAWGRVTVGGFDAKAPAEKGTVRLDGEVTTGILGADAQWERWLAGVALSVSKGEGTFDQPGVDSGNIESTLTSVNPYVRVTLSDRVSAWGLLGYGTGDMTMTQAATEDRGEVVTRTDLSMRLGAVGARGALLEAGETGGLDLALRGDAFLVQMESEKAANTVATKAEASRLRLVLEGSRAFALGEGAVLTPGLEVGVRHDGGDAETGSGIEVGGRISYTDAGSGLTVEANARTLIAHEDSGYREWGAGGSVRLDPGVSGRGLSLTVAPEWGTPSSGVDRLWSARDAAGLSADDNGNAPAESGRLEAEFGYGIAMFGGGFTGTPYLGFGLTDGGRDYRLGWRLNSAERGDRGLALDLEATQRETADGNAEHGLMLLASIRW